MQARKGEIETSIGSLIALRMLGRLRERSAKTRVSTVSSVKRMVTVGGDTLALHHGGTTQIFPNYYRS